MSSPIRIKRKPVCPPAPKREEIKAKIAVKEEAARQKMMEEATHKLAYLKTLRDLVDKTPSPSIKAKVEMMKHFNTQIQDLEVDVMGKPRYSYNLHYPTDIGFAPNGREPVFADKKFSSAAEVSKFIREYIEGDDMTFDKAEYTLPSTMTIENMLMYSTKVEIDVNDEDEDECEEKVPPFTVTCTRINY